jgi:hypothetical protein
VSLMINKHIFPLRIACSFWYRKFLHKRVSGSPCHRMSTLTLMKSLTFFLVVPSGIRDAKCDAKESELLPLMKRFLMS